MSDAPIARTTHQPGEVARLISYVVLLAASVALFFVSRGIPTSRFEKLGAGAFPTLIYGVMSLLLVMAIINAVRRIPSDAYAHFGAAARDWVRRSHLVFAVFICLAIYLAAIPVTGFSPATLVFLLVLQLILAPKTPRALITVVILSVLFSFGLNWLFAEVFNVFLPRGGA